MKSIPGIVAVLFLLQSCQAKEEQNQLSQTLVGQCDELDIVYYVTDTFVFKTIDTSSIKFFKELVTSDNEELKDTCEPNEQIIYKNKGKEIFAADISTKNIKDSIGCECVTYTIDNKRYRHRLTYRHGMAIDQIYWRKVDSAANPWTGLDTKKFKYEEKQSNH